MTQTLGIFTPTKIEKNFFVDSVASKNRGSSFSLGDVYGSKMSKMYMQDARIHDANLSQNGS